MSKKDKEKKGKKSVKKDRKKTSTTEMEEAKLTAQKLFSKLKKGK